MMAIQRASVKFYNDEKGFGFVRVLDENSQPTGKELFFHRQSARGLIEGKEAPEFAAPLGKDSSNDLSAVPTPKRHDILVIEEGRGSRGQRVRYWNFSSEYDRIAEVLAKQAVYRVMHRRHGYDAPEIVEVEWQGKSIFNLSATYPKTGTTDALLDRTMDTMYVRWLYHFELLHDDGSWTNTNDPRVQICCVPADIYRQHNHGRQPTCHHANR